MIFRCVQWYEVLSGNKRKIGKVDEARSCMRLRGHRTFEQNSVLSAGQEFGLITIDSFRRLLAYIMSKNLYFFSGCRALKRKKAAETLFAETLGWDPEQLHVNRFYIQWSHGMNE